MYPQLMEEREKAATRRESIRTNGIAEAEEGSDDDNDDEEDRHPPTVKVYCIVQVAFKNATQRSFY